MKQLVVVCSLALVVSGCTGRSCDFPAENARPLDLTHAADREHLSRDITTAREYASAFGRWAARHPPSDSRFITAERLEEHARTYCRALLVDKIASTHALTDVDVEHAFADAEAARVDR